MSGFIFLTNEYLNFYELLYFLWLKFFLNKDGFLVIEPCFFSLIEFIFILIIRAILYAWKNSLFA